MITPEMIERAARAIYDTNRKPWDPNWHLIHDSMQDGMRKLAKAALTGALGDTHVVVPRDVLEPFEDIVGEGDEDFADNHIVEVRFGRTTSYALRLGDMRRLQAVANDLPPIPAERGGDQPVPKVPIAKQNQPLEAVIGWPRAALGKEAE